MPAILIVTGDVRFVRLMPPVRRSQRQPQRAEWRRALTARLPRTGMINSFRVLACARGSGTTQPGPLLHSQDRLGSAPVPRSPPIFDFVRNKVSDSRRVRNAFAPEPSQANDLAFLQKNRRERL
jgi:hypothetical protein